MLWHAVSTQFLQSNVGSSMRPVDGYTDMLHNVSTASEVSFVKTFLHDVQEGLQA